MEATIGTQGNLPDWLPGYRVKNSWQRDRCNRTSSLEPYVNGAPLPGKSLWFSTRPDVTVDVFPVKMAMRRNVFISRCAAEC